MFKLIKRSRFSLATIGMAAIGMATCLFAPPVMVPAAAQAVVGRIIASVNDDAITGFDLTGRMNLIAAASRTKLDNQNRPRIARLALRELIDDTIKLQEAKRLGISASNKEVGAAIQTIERNNKLPSGGLLKQLTSANVPVDSLINQLKATIAWRKVLRRRVLPQVRVATNEVDDALSRIRDAGGGYVARVSEIVLSAETPEKMAAAQARAAEIARQLASGGNFAKLARLYSRAPTAAVGGDMGEVQLGQLTPVLEAVLNALEPGQVSAPTEANGALNILKLTARQTVETGESKEAVITLARLFLRPRANQTAKAQIENAKAAVAGLDSCDAFEAAAKQLGPKQPPRIVDARIGDMPEEVRDTIDALKVGEQSDVVAIANGVAIFMLCRRTETGKGLPSAERVAEAIQRQRAERRGERYLRDLRRLALINIRK